MRERERETHISYKRFTENIFSKCHPTESIPLDALDLEWQDSHVERDFYSALFLPCRKILTRVICKISRFFYKGIKSREQIQQIQRIHESWLSEVKAEQIFERKHRFVYSISQEKLLSGYTSRILKMRCTRSRLNDSYQIIINYRNNFSFVHFSFNFFWTMHFVAPMTRLKR